MHRYLLVLRFALLNLVASGVLVAMYLHGWLDGMLLERTRWMCLAIAGVFLFGLLLCAAKVWRTSVELNGLESGAPEPGSRADRYLAGIRGHSPESRAISADLLRRRLANQISIVRHTANTLVFLGLIGTVIGFIIALSGVDPQATSSVSNVAPMVGTLIGGMSVALYTTLVGAVLHVWLMVNHRMLATGTLHLFHAMVELGEARAGL